MKKNLYSLLFMAVALFCATVFTSCDKKDEPIADPEPELVPVDSIVGYLTYDYNEVALKLFDFKYEVTDFNGKKETFTITEPGKVEKVYKAKKITDVATAKLTITAKDISDLEIGDKLYIKLLTFAYSNVYISKKYFTSNATFYTSKNYHIFTYDKEFTKEADKLSKDFIEQLQDMCVGTFEAKIALSEDFIDGVPKEWYDTSSLLLTK